MADDLETPAPEPTESTSEGGVKSPLSLLADSLYGAPKIEEPEAPDAPDEKAASSEEAAAPEGEEAEEVELSSLNELAEHFELDPEWVQTLKLPIKVNGETSEATISELVSSYRLGKATEAELQKAKEKAGEIITEAKQKQEAVASTLMTLNELLQEEQEAIERDSNSIDWKALRESDPAEHAAKKVELQERRERLEARKKKAGESYQQLVQKHQHEMQQRLQVHLSQEHAKLVQAIPDLGDEAKGPALKAKIAEDLIARGFTKEEVAQAYDSRLVQMAYEAMLYRQGKGKLETVKKKVVKIPKVLKPGSKSKEAPKSNGAAKKDDPVSILYG